MKNRNKKSRGRTVLNQHLKDIKTEKTYSNEDSPHWDWTFEHGYQTENDEVEEHNRANPDSLPEHEDTYHQRQIEEQDLIAEVKYLLTRREYQVFDLLEKGLNQSEIGVVLQISQPTVSMTIQRIRKKFLKAGYKNDDNAS